MGSVMGKMGKFWKDVKVGHLIGCRYVVDKVTPKWEVEKKLLFNEFHSKTEYKQKVASVLDEACLQGSLSGLDSVKLQENVRFMRPLLRVCE